MTTYRSAWMALSLCASALACPCLAAPASGERTQAQPSEPPSTPADEAVTELSPVVVESSATTIPLDLPTGVASPLGLSVRETPNAVEVLTQERLQREGARTLIEAYRSAAGVSAGNLPGEPGVTSLRGFSRGETGYLIDGMRAIDPLLVSRNYDTWNFERIEVLKGPASVTNGVGALAGAINLVTKKPSFESPSQEALFSYGSFGSWRAAVGGNQPLSDQVAVRADAVLSQSAGYVHDTASRTGALTTGLSFKASERLTLMAMADYYYDHFSTPYQGTPLLPREMARDPSGIVSAPGDFIIDRALRRTNYNVSDGLMKSDAVWLRSQAQYRLDANWQLINELGYYDANRYWTNSEDYSYDASTALLDRSTTKITHDHRFISERLYLKQDDDWNGHRNRLAGGVEYATTEFDSVRRFGTTTPVDPFAPARGYFPADSAANFDTRTNFDSDVDSTSAFIEDALTLMPGVLAVAGARHEHIDLDRRIHDLNTDATTTFGRDFDTTSWRLGAVIDVASRTQFYASYNQASSPISSLLLSSQRNVRFDLSSGHSIETGIKSTVGTATITTSVYQIDQDDILTRDPANYALTIQGGSQRSRGAELDLEWRPLPRWRLDANASHVDAEFTRLREANGADRKGNRPPNVPATTFNLNTDYTWQNWPVRLGAALHHAGDFYTDDANTIRVAGHTTLDASISWWVGPHTFTLRCRNLTDKFYAEWSGYAPDMIYLAPPRSIDLTWNLAF